MSLAIPVNGAFYSGDEIFDANRLRLGAAWVAHNVKQQYSGEPGPLINDCQQRQDFAATLLAGAILEQPCLLPGRRAPELIAELEQQYPNAQHIERVSWADLADVALPTEWLNHPFSVDADQQAVVGFTSGSTGRPKALIKTWRMLLGVTDRVCQVMNLLAENSKAVVATVPAQHMYGLESSVLVALASNARVDADRPFFPADVVAALQQATDQCGDRSAVLVTTPMHLRVILQSGLPVPPLASLFSATAPLPIELAEQAAACFSCPVKEIYGSTETGAIASREPLKTQAWGLFPNVQFCDRQSAELQSDHLPAGVVLQDQVQVLDDRQFELIGRPESMIKVAGKRYSLDALTEALMSLEAVQDAAVWLPAGAERPAAVVVAPGCTASVIRKALAPKVDAVFLPRPLKLVDQIDRNATGKVPVAALNRLLS